MWKPDNSLIIILSQASARTEDLLPCSADNQLIFMLLTGALWKVIMTAIMPSANEVTVQLPEGKCTYPSLSHTHTHVYRGITQMHIACPHAYVHVDKQMYTYKHIQAHKRSHTHTHTRVVRVQKYRKSQQTADSGGKRLAPGWKRSCLDVINSTNIKVDTYKEVDVYIISLLTQYNNWQTCFFKCRQRLWIHM